MINNYQNQDNHLKEQHWHLKKEINIAHVMTTLTLIIACMIYFVDLDKQISSNTLLIKYVTELRKEDQGRIEKRLDVIDRKLDKLLTAK
ncbi:MAG: hypothetical protein HRT37_17085 [Alteromonadaceae bacterium]|nr:hypothetical protein [Alteromonadaceae bacterium]